MRIPVNMATPGLDVCPECKNLIVKVEGAWLDVWTSGPYYADDTRPHKHQPQADDIPQAGPRHRPDECQRANCQQYECN